MSTHAVAHKLAGAISVASRVEIQPATKAPVVGPSSAQGLQRAASPSGHATCGMLLTGIDSTMHGCVFEDFKLSPLCQDCYRLGPLHPAHRGGLGCLPNVEGSKLHTCPHLH